MDISELIENFNTGLFESRNGQKFIKCEFNPNEPIWIDVTGETWEATYAGRLNKICWGKIIVSSTVKREIKQILCGRLKTRSPYYLNKVEIALLNLFKSCSLINVNLKEGFSDISQEQWLSIWALLDSQTRSTVRSLYTELAEKSVLGADFSIASEMDGWKARSDTEVLSGVLNWDAHRGSFTSAEWELIRRSLINRDENESDADCATRIFGRILNETLKRPQQVLSMKQNSLWSAPFGNEYFLRIPKAKGQAGARDESWKITNDLADDIQSYSERSTINKLQNKYDRLIVFPSKKGTKDLSWMSFGQIDAQTAKSRLSNFAEIRKIISPRTNEVINFTPYRIRHTGATTMAIQGVPREVIQETLEHDSPYSADAYISAVGSDLIPAIEKATSQGVGVIFSELRDAYFFKGSITDKVEKKPVFIPIIGQGLSQPAVIGSCGKNGSCSQHPFWACYNGCPHFLAWRDAPHQQSLDFVEAELNRWSDSEGGKERSKLGKDFDRIGAAIHEVINQIKEEKKG